MLPKMMASWRANVRSNLEKHLDPLKNHPHFEGGIVMSVLTIFFLMVVYFVWNLSPAHPGDSQKKTFEVPFGESLRTICDKLEKRGIIRNSLVFEIYVRLNPEQRMPKAGHYQVSSGMSMLQIVRTLEQGTVKMVRITIPEGLTVKDVAELLASKDLVVVDDFMRLASDRRFVRRFINNLPPTKGAEGYLFPDTYEFNSNASSEQIITEMLKQFQKEYDRHFKKIPAAKKHKIVILASIIEKEAKKGKERPIIAGVFYNRLQKGYPLQSCATIQYALGYHKERLLYKDLQIKSDYNTYIHPGLPPGPIANPGLDSLKAAAFPKKVSYLYFFAQPDGSHFFSNTYAEHMKAQKRLSRQRVSAKKPN